MIAVDEIQQAAQALEWAPAERLQLTSVTALTLQYQDMHGHAQMRHLPCCNALLAGDKLAELKLRELRLHAVDLMRCDRLAKLPLAISSLTLLALDQCLLPNLFCNEFVFAQPQKPYLTDCGPADADVVPIALKSSLPRSSLRVLDLKGTRLTRAKSVALALDVMTKSKFCFKELSFDDTASEAEIQEVRKMWRNVCAFMEEYQVANAACWVTMAAATNDAISCYDARCCVTPDETHNGRVRLV